jgi:hypothetical protein
MSRFVRHRYLVYLPFAMFFVATVLGGWINTIELRGRVVDDLTSDGVKAATVTHGQRSVTTDETGAFDFANLPKSSRLVVDAPGYFRQGVPTTQEEIRMAPNSLTVVVKEAGASPEKFIAKADVRQGDKVLGTTTDGGNTVISPHPGKDQTVLVCAEGYASQTVPVHGVAMTVELATGGTGCPPLPSPSPSASPSGSAAPSGSASPSGSAAPSATPSASPSPSPTTTP